MLAGVEYHNKCKLNFLKNTIDTKNHSVSFANTEPHHTIQEAVQVHSMSLVSRLLLIQLSPDKFLRLQTNCQDLRHTNVIP